MTQRVVSQFAGKVMVAGLLLAICLPAQSQPPRLEFEVASVKPNIDGGPRVSIGEKSPGTFSGENVTLQALIQEAWGITIERPWLPFRIAPQQGLQILGGPAWMGSDRFDIVAKWKPAGERGTVESEQRAQVETHLMLRTLLEQRFHLKLHREIRDLPDYELTIARNAAKLTRGPCTAFDPANPLPPGLSGKVHPNYCGNSRIGRKGLDWTLDGTAMNMAELAGTLSQVIGRRTVLDKTGFTGTFDVHLQWTPGLGETGDSDAPVAPDSSGPSIFAVLQERLGLKLNAGRGPVEVLVIEYVEKPSGN